MIYTCGKCAKEYIKKKCYEKHINDNKCIKCKVTKKTNIMIDNMNNVIINNDITTTTETTKNKNFDVKVYNNMSGPKIMEELVSKISVSEISDFVLKIIQNEEYEDWDDVTINFFVYDTIITCDVIKN